MSEQQVWRVVLATGEVREVGVTHMPATDSTRECWAIRFENEMVYCFSHNEALSTAVREADICEVLAPGEMTRAEAVAAARREGAEAMRAAALAAVDDAVEAAGLDADLSLDAHTAVTHAVVSAVRALLLPGGATPEHSPTEAQ